MSGLKLKNVRLWMRKLGTQMTAIVVALFFVTVLSLSMMGRSAMESELLGVTQRYVEQVLDQVINNVEYYVRDMESIAQIADSRPEILSLLFDEGPKEYSRSSYYHKSQAVQQLLRSVSTMRGELANIIIVGENGAMSDIRNNYYTALYTDLGDMRWYGEAVRSGGRFIYSPPYIQHYSLGKSEPVLSIARAISMYEGGKPLGAIVIELNLQALRQICSTVTLHKSGYIFIIDRERNFIYHPDDKYVSRTWIPGDAAAGFEDDEAAERILAGETSFITGKGDERRYFISRPLANAQWVAVGVVPYDEIFTPARTVGNTQLALGIAAALVVAAVIAILLSRMVFGPIESLRLVLGRMENGDLNVVAPVTSDNEIGQFSHGFNVMTRRLKDLMESLVKNEKAKRRAELAALYAQINPHFLYNTLDAIVWMAEYNPPEAAEMAQRLAELFRLALGKGEDITTITQEMQYIEHYLSIQKMRYKSRFTYRVEWEPEVGEQLLPKLVVQVLAENAIYHGIKQKRQKCFLLVRARLEGDNVVVQVVDDGVGMSSDRLGRIFDGSTSKKAWGGIGVRNARERLQLYYGAKAGFEYYSVPEVGTLAEISIPFTRRDS